MSSRHSDAAARLPASPDDIDIAAIGAAIKRHALKLVLASAIAGAAAFAITKVMVPRYMSQAQIEIISKGVGNPFEQRRESGSAPDNVTVRMDKEAIGTHVRGLMSTDLALKVARDLELAKLPEFNSALREPGFLKRHLGFLASSNPRETAEDRVLKSYMEAMRAYQVKETRGIVVEFTSIDPELAGRAANRIVELYRDALSLRAVSETNDARAKLGPQIMKLAGEVAEAEAAVTRFRGQSNIFEAGRERTGLNEQQLTELTADLTRVASVRAEAEARAREARDIAKRGYGETLADVQKSQLVPRLVEQRVRVERQVSELSASLLPGHPRMKQLQADLSSLNSQINAEVDKIVQGLEREAKVTAMREEGIRRRLDEAKRRVVDAGGDDVKLRALESIAKSKRAEFERLQAQAEAARSTSDANAVPGEVQLISRARPSHEKASPKAVMIVSMASFATFLVGLSIIIVHALFSGARAASGSSLAHGTHGFTPMRPNFPALTNVPVTLRAVRTSATLEEVARTLVDKAQHRSGFRSMVSAAHARGHVGRAPIDLARQLSRLNRQVILLDCSRDGVGIAKGAAQKPRRGLADVLAGTATFEDVITPLPGTSVHMIAAGGAMGEAAAAVDRDRINMLLDALDEVYDHIVVTGDWHDLRDLFRTIQGCIDAGIVVASPGVEFAGGDFLGYQVSDLDVIHFEAEADSSDAHQDLGAFVPSGAAV